MRKERAPGPYKGVARAGTSPGTDWPRAPPDHQLTTGTSKGGKGPSPGERDYEQDGRGIHIFIVNPVYVSKLNLTNDKHWSGLYMDTVPTFNEAKESDTQIELTHKHIYMNGYINDHK